MIDHISIGVRDLARATNFYDELLATLEYERLETRPATVGYGKRYPEFWLNLRAGREPTTGDNGAHFCLRATSVDVVNRFHESGVRLGAISGGEPGIRPEYSDQYYAAFIIDRDQNLIEVVTFVDPL